MPDTIYVRLGACEPKMATGLPFGYSGVLYRVACVCGTVSPKWPTSGPEAELLRNESVAFRKSEGICARASGPANSVSDAGGRFIL